MRKVAIILALMLVLGVVAISGCVINQNNTTGIGNKSINASNIKNKTNFTNTTVNKTINSTIQKINKKIQNITG